MVQFPLLAARNQHQIIELQIQFNLLKQLCVIQYQMSQQSIQITQHQFTDDFNIIINSNTFPEENVDKSLNAIALKK